MSKEISLLRNAVPNFRGNEKPEEMARALRDGMLKEIDGLQFILEQMEEKLQKQQALIDALQKGAGK